MKILHTKEELISFRASLDECSPTVCVGLVPTMGALHNGHKSLIQASLSENQHTIVSVFVNPTQFAPNEDLSTYPRTLESDCALCADLGVSAVFAPNVEEMYESPLDAQFHNDEVSMLPPRSMGYVLEGFARPTHFSGVLQVVMKLFMLTRAHNAYFGRKDAQQILLIRRMVQDLFIPIQIRDCPIVRDIDGLALSSRNIYLSKEERARALAIPRALESILQAYNNGEIHTNTLRAIGLRELKGVEVEYLQICNENLRAIKQVIAQKSLVLLAARIGTTRLLDNLWL